MKINHYTRKRFPRLRDMPFGIVIRFVGAVCQKHKIDDWFIVNEVCSSYAPKSRHYRASNPHIPVTNLRTGSLAYVSGDREVIEIECEVSRCGLVE